MCKKGIISALVMLLFFSCNWDSTASFFIDKPTVSYDIDSIQTAKVLRVGTTMNYYSYFIYKDREYGFEYELLKKLAEDLHVILVMVPVRNQDSLYNFLNTGRVDIVANHLSVNVMQKKYVNFTYATGLSKLVLVQRKNTAKDSTDKNVIRNLFSLEDDTIYVRQNSAAHKRAINLLDETDAGFIIKTLADTLNSEDILQMVSEGKIDYTIADEQLAKLNATYYPNLDYKTDVSFPHKIGWAIRNNNPKFERFLNRWIKKQRNSLDYKNLYARYFEMQKHISYAPIIPPIVTDKKISKKSRKLNGAISSYDEIIRKNAKRIGWDWRIIAAVIQEESGFNNSAQSWSGATGLMQIIPSTVAKLGGDSASARNPEKNIEMGCRLLKKLDNIFINKIPDPFERIKFVLAAYNAGQGHVIDARALAAKQGKNPAVWNDNVAICMLQKSKPEFYNDPVVKFGYCRGIETYNYVAEVLLTYERYKALYYDKLPEDISQKR